MTVNMKTAVKEVTVYPDRARITCTGTCQVSAQTTKIILDELPLLLDPDSARVGGAGTARVRLLGVDIASRFYEESPAEKVKELEQELDEAGDALRVLEDKQAGWVAHGVYLDGLRQATREYARGLSRGQATIEDQASLVTFLQGQDEGMRTAVRELEKEKRQLMRRLDKLRRELKSLQSARPQKRLQAVIEIEVMEPGEFHPTLTYVVRNAGWRPLYDVRYLENEDEPTVEITTLAQITQDTGQDWLGVRLAVSTARPALNQRLPELKPWFVDVVRPPAPRAKSRAKMMAAPMETQGARPPQAAAADPVPEAMAAEVVIAETVSDSGAAVSYLISGETDIPSDGSPHKNTIAHSEFTPMIDYLSVPKHTDAVYRRAKITNNQSGPMLAGQAALFVNDEFIGRTKLAYTPVGTEFELLLGVEERLTVERELVKRDVDKRLLRDNRQMRFGYEIKLENLLGSEVSVVIHDHIPVSRHENIKVKLERVVPEPTEASDLNLLEWHETLPGGGKLAIRYEYLVEHPRDYQVAGLLD